MKDRCVKICVKNGEVMIIVVPASIKDGYIVEVNGHDLNRLFSSHPDKGLIGNNAMFRVRSEEDIDKHYIDINFGCSLIENNDIPWVKLVLPLKDMDLAKDICNQLKQQVFQLDIKEDEKELLNK